MACSLKWRHKSYKTLCLCVPYLVVIGAVGAEIRLRTKHLVHHIQAAHGEEITDKNQASLIERVWSDGAQTVIQEVVESGTLSDSLRWAALRSLRTALTLKGTPTASNPPPPPPATHPFWHLLPTNPSTELRLRRNGLLITEHQRTPLKRGAQASAGKNEKIFTYSFDNYTIILCSMKTL